MCPKSFCNNIGTYATFPRRKTKAGMSPKPDIAGPVVIAERQRTGISFDDEPIHLPAVDLALLGEESMDQITAPRIERNERIDTERMVRQIRGNSRIDRARIIFLQVRRAQSGIERARERLVRLAVLIDLRSNPVQVPQSLRARKQAVEIVEAAVLQVQHDDVPDAIKTCRRSG